MKRLECSLLVSVILFCTGTEAQTTFSYTGGVQTYTVPACVYSITVDIKGAEGSTVNSAVSQAGKGGRVQATFPVTPSEVLNIYVGGMGSATAGGWNGGANPGAGSGGGGGGGSDIRQGGNALSNRIVAAAGGGGAGGVYSSTNSNGGNGGGLTGANGWFNGSYSTNWCGSGGTQTAGGAAATSNGSVAGSSGSGGMGGTQGGGGGGGYYGGGGGSYGGGGGGSSYASPSATGTITITAGYQAGNGEIIITPITGASQPGPITGPATVCAGSTITYSVTNNPSSTYSWTVPPGWTVNSGQNTNSISVTAGTSAGNISVTASNNCGTSAPRTQAITVNPSPAVTLTPASAAICESASVNLSAGGASTYTWSPAATLNTGTGANVTASPSVTTTYTVTGTGANGCSSTATAAITVNPPPVVSVVSSATAICSGDSVDMSASGADIYSWSPASDLSADTGSNVTAVPPATITYTVTGTNSNGCTDTSSITLTVNALPPSPAISASGSTTFCEGDSVQLTSSSSMNNTWSTGSTDQSIWVSSPGTYSVSITDSNSCSSSSGPLAITVNPLPSVSFSGLNSSYCSTSSASVLTGSPSGGSFSGPGVTAGSFDPTAAGMGTHIISYTYTDGNGCSSTSSQTTTVAGSAAVNLGPDMSICTTDQLTISAGNFNSYLWNDGSTSSSIMVNGSQLSPGTYTYYVTVSDGGSCSATDSINVTVINCTVNVNDLSFLTDVTVTPNPTSGHLVIIIEFPPGSISSASLEICAVDGRSIFHRELVNVSGKHTEPVDISHADNGMYLLKVSSGVNVTVKKIVLNK